MAGGWDRLADILHQVSKPGRYSGGEFNTQVKNWDQVKLKVALAFPDLYEIGLSHLGLRILYELINTQPELLAERVYTPWPDFQALLRQMALPLYSLENKRPLNDFDVVGFSLQYELSYTNILTVLDLGGIPFFSKDRDQTHPLVIGGGPCAFNPEPLADFFDFFLIGEAEAVLIPILETISRWKASGAPKDQLLTELESFEGVYVPAHFQIEYHENQSLKEIKALTKHHPVRAVARDFSQTPAPQEWLVPFLEIVHDRVVCEIQRGCTKGCRFCQAGMLYRPVREKDPGPVMEYLKKVMAKTGYHELSLTSLSSADYSQIERLLTDACGCFTPQRINVTLPSLRVDSFSVALAKQFQGNRKGSLTFAPEAGTERLRRVINKGVNAADLMTAAEAAFRAGWQKLKLYFMIGLPTETQTDLEGIVDLSNQVLQLGKRLNPRGNALRITVSVSTFVPKSHTPFQWRPQISVTETQAKQAYLQEHLRGRHLELNWHDPRMSQLEGIMARGDRRLSAAIETAWRKGAQFDSWSDYFNYQIWLDSFRDLGIDPDFYTRQRHEAEVLPWSHINSGLSTEFLARENRLAELGELTSDCRENACSVCGVCATLKVAKRIAGVTDV